MEKLEKRVEKMERAINLQENFNEKAYLGSGKFIDDVQFYCREGTFLLETPEVVKTAITQAHEEYFEFPLCRNQEKSVISDLTLKDKCLALMLTVCDHKFERDRLDREIQSYRSTLTDEELEEFEAETKRIREMTNEELAIEYKRQGEECDGYRKSNFKA